MPMPLVKSTLRAFAILELFDRERRALTASEVQKALGYPQSSTFALLRSMTSVGYLAAKRGTKAYVPTARVRSLGRWVDEHRIDEIAFTELSAVVASVTGEIVTLSVCEDLAMRIVHVTRGPAVGDIAVNAGQTLSLVHSAVGQAFLSTLCDGEVMTLVRRIELRSGRRLGHTAVDLLLAQLRLARRRGFAVAYDRVRPGVGAVAAPIASRLVEPPTVLSVSGPSERMHRNEAAVVAQIRRAVQRRSALLDPVLLAH